MNGRKKNKRTGIAVRRETKHEINRMVSPDLLYLVADPILQTAGERWMKLEDQFQKDTTVNQLHGDPSSD